MLSEDMAMVPADPVKHAKLFDALFQDDIWLSFVCSQGADPKLLGSNLFLLHEAEDITKCEAYLLLHCGYQRENLDLNRELLAKSLRPWKWHDYSGYKYNDLGPRENSEIYFLENKITLNIQQPWGSLGNAVISRPLKLLSEQDNVLHAAYIHWKNDGFTLRAVDPKYMTKTSLKEIAHRFYTSPFYMYLPQTRETASSMHNSVFLNLVPIGGRNSEMVSWYGMPLSWGFPAPPH
jgi:hypothetical protein